MVGFYIGLRGRVDWFLLLNTILGTTLVACGGSALNQLLERDFDARMRRTRDRPLPSGRLQPQTVLVVGAACAGRGSELPGGGGERDDQPGGSGDLRALRLHLHPSQASDLAQYRRWGHPWGRCRRSWAGPRLGGSWASRPWLCSASRPFGNCLISWPSPGFTGTSMPRPGSRCCRWRPRRAPHQPPGPRPCAGLMAGQSMPVLAPLGRGDLFCGALDPGRGFCLGRHSIYSRPKPLPRPLPVLHLHPLLAALVGRDGARQDRRLETPTLLLLNLQRTDANRDSNART